MTDPAPRPDPAELARRRHAAQRLAVDAGATLLEHAGRIEFEAKLNAQDLVTAADRASEALILERLQRLFPDDGVVAEESDGKEGASRRQADLRAAPFAWCVDPLDGTTNFVHGYPSWAVSIGLLAHGRPVLGVVFAPARKELFVGGIDHPSTLGGNPIRVSRAPSLDRALVATGFPPNRRERVDVLLPVVRRVLLECHGIRRAGAAALDLCDVAAGRLDAYYEWGLAPWDVVAGQAIVESAGGRVSATDGGAHDPFAGSILASNGVLHADAVRLVTGP